MDVDVDVNDEYCGRFPTCSTNYPVSFMNHPDYPMISRKTMRGKVSRSLSECQSIAYILVAGVVDSCPKQHRHSKCFFFLGA